MHIGPDQCHSSKTGYRHPAIAAHAALGLLLLLLIAAPCVALECPTAQPAGAPGAIQETPAQISELSQVLASGDLGNRIPVFVRALHSRHPDASTGELVNYLVTAYCPVVNSLTGLSDGEKQARMDAFITQVTVAAY